MAEEAAAPGGAVTELKENSLDAEDIHSYMCLGTRFDVPERYVVVDSVGQGAYGVVWYDGQQHARVPLLALSMAL